MLLACPDLISFGPVSQSIKASATTNGRQREQKSLNRKLVGPGRSRRLRRKKAAEGTRSGSQALIGPAALWLTMFEPLAARELATASALFRLCHWLSLGPRSFSGHFSQLASSFPAPAYLAYLT